MAAAPTGALHVASGVEAPRRPPGQLPAPGLGLRRLSCVAPFLLASWSPLLWRRRWLPSGELEAIGWARQGAAGDQARAAPGAPPVPAPVPEVMAGPEVAAGSGRGPAARPHPGFRRPRRHSRLPKGCCCQVGAARRWPRPPACGWCSALCPRSAAGPPVPAWLAPAAAAALPTLRACALRWPPAACTPRCLAACCLLRPGVALSGPPVRRVDNNTATTTTTQQQQQQHP